MKYDEKDLSLLKRALFYLKPFLKDIIFVMACILLSSVLNIVLPLINKAIIDQGLVNKNVNIVIIYSLLTFALILAVQGLELLQTKFYANVNVKYQFALFYAACKKMLQLKIDYFTCRNSAEIINNLSTDVSNVSKISDKSTFLIIDQVFRMLSGIVGLCILSWKLTILVLCIAPLKYIIVKKLSQYRKKTVNEYLEQNRLFYSWFGDMINGIKEIKLFILQRFETSQFVKKQKDILKSDIKLAFIDKYNQCAETLLYQILNCLLYIFGAILIVKNSLTVGGLFSFITYSAYVTGPLSAIINLLNSYANFLPSAKRLFAFMDEETEASSKVSASCKHVRIENKKCSIRFENVSFSYSNGRDVLKNVNFEIFSGEKVAIIGANGSGKTTLLNLLLRFYVPDTGTVSFDSINIQQLKLNDYRNKFSVVSQDPYLFNTTIQDNIDLDKKSKAGKIVEASIKSGAKSFIEKLPEEYKTVVGKNGAHLSGGEKQKIAVARAFLRDSPVIVFDEATSNFDSFSDDYLNRVTFTEFSNKTVIVITHKNDILRYMDKVFFLKDGRLVQLNETTKASLK